MQIGVKLKQLFSSSSSSRCYCIFISKKYYVGIVFCCRCFSCYCYCCCNFDNDDRELEAEYAGAVKVKRKEKARAGDKLYLLTQILHIRWCM